ncbi:unnamed protein product, partial [Linum tenue]
MHLMFGGQVVSSSGNRPHLRKSASRPLVFDLGSDARVPVAASFLPLMAAAARRRRGFEEEGDRFRGRRGLGNGNKLDIFVY